MPTLLQINVVANWGSTGRIAEEIGQTALAAGWRSLIAYGRGNPTSKSELIRIGNDWDMYEHIFESRLLDNQGLASRRATQKFIRRIAEIKPNVVHLHNVHGYYLNYDLLFQYLVEKDIPVVWTMHDCWPFTGHCAHFVFEGCDKWKKECSHCPLKYTYPRSVFIDQSTRNYYLKYDRFTAVRKLTLVPVSDWLADLVKLSFLKEKTIKRIYNGVDTSVFTSCEARKNVIDIRKVYGLNEKKIVLGVASVWNARKGLDDFIKVVKHLPIEKYHIVLVGLNKEQKAHLPKGIIGVMRTANVQELAVYYRAADVFVNTTYEDTFPTVNLEALACGTPVVTYRTGGSVEAISPETGRIVEQGDIQGLVQAIQELAEDQTDYKKNCRDRAVNLFDKRERYQEYIRLYHNIISNK